MTDHPVRTFADEHAIRRLGESFLACTLPKAEWTHEAHIGTCAWIILERADIAPEQDLPGLIRRYNESVGGVNDATQGYHETITQVSIAGIRAALGRNREGELAERVNWLLHEPEGKRGWPMLLYSTERLFSAEARLGWVDPDRLVPPGYSARGSGEGTVHPFRSRTVARPNTNHRSVEVADLSQVKQHMEVVGADGVKVGTVDKVEGDRIKLTKADSGSHKGHHHYLSGGLVAAVEGNNVRLSANADNAVLLEEEKGGGAISDKSGGTLKKVAIGAAVVGAVAGAGALVARSRGKRKVDTADSDQNSGA